jgi:hypothetical protein
MQYCIFELNPFGKYKCTCLHTGFSLDIVCTVVENSLLCIDVAHMYIDDVGDFSTSCEHHIELLSTIIQHLQDNRFTINPLKCESAIQKKIGLVTCSHPVALSPGRRRSMWSYTWTILFIPLTFSVSWAVYYYCDMWPSHDHVLNILQIVQTWRKINP